MVNHSPGVSVTEQSTVVLVGNFRVTELDQELIVLDLQTEAYFGLDGAGAALWRLLETPQLVSSLHTFLLAQYQVEPTQGWTDLLAFLQQLADAKLIEVRGEVA